MAESKRMIQPGSPPTDSQVAVWIGEKAFGYWKQVAGLIDRNYPGVFVPDWIFGGKKHGWCLRYKKGKSFCTLISEKDRCALVMVFGAEERKKVESVKDRLSPGSRKEYEAATTYHDGTWVLITVDSAPVLEDVCLLLAVKRKPNIGKRA